VLGRNGPRAARRAARPNGARPPGRRALPDWLGGLLTGDLGNSAADSQKGSERPIWGEISGEVGNSLILALLAAIIMIPVSLALGVLAAVRAGRLTDHAVSAGSLAVISLPEFIIGSLLILLFSPGWGSSRRYRSSRPGEPARIRRSLYCRS
jgi:peptide/nickel transport system permease protein